MAPHGYVYILASKRNGTLYIGVTSNMTKRLWQHQNNSFKGFTQQYGVKTLVHMEQYPSMDQAIAREKAMKKWRRKWKIDLIEKNNPSWNDLLTGFPLSRE
jgi:putative endonuclease